MGRESKPDNELVEPSAKLNEFDDKACQIKVAGERMAEYCSRLASFGNLHESDRDLLNKAVAYWQDVTE